MEILGMLVSFENFIFVDEDVKEKLIKEGIFNNNFSKAKNSGTEGVYKYKFSRNDIFQYNELVFSKKN
jgi:ACT domain-containing protein